jgi:Fe-S cluster biogenesis protein NfuA
MTHLQPSADPAHRDRSTGGETDGDYRNTTAPPTGPAELGPAESLRVLIEVIRPALQADGGDIELVDVDIANGVVRVKLTGACGSCGVAEITLNAGIERVVRQRLPWVTAVVGEVEESDVSGTGGWVPR